MKHSIIIPHRNRLEHLKLCLWALRDSALRCEVSDVEFLVVDAGEHPLPDLDPGMRVVRWVDPMPTFNKSTLLNCGLARAWGKFVTILDADAIVGPLFFDAASALVDPKLTRVCYRVRPLSIADSDELLDARNLIERNATLYRLRNEFNKPGRFKPVWEAYRFPDRNRYEPDCQPWGNSQFTMRKHDLAGLSYDQRQVGKGWEDVDFNRQVWRRFGHGYRGRIFTDAEYAMLHLTGPKDPRWDNETNIMANHRRYKERWPLSCDEEERLS